MTETTFTPHAKLGEPLAVIRHTDAASAWATSEERTSVFSVVRPNPEYGTAAYSDETPPPADIVIDYTMPARPNAGLALAYLKQARANADLAMSWLIETAIGSDGYDALVEEMASMTDPDEVGALLQGIVQRIQKVAMGGLDGQGNAPKR